MNPILLGAWFAFLAVILAFMGLEILLKKEHSFTQSLSKFKYDQGWLIMAKRIGPVVASFFPLVSMDRLRNKLVWAGNPWGLSAEEFIGVKIVCLGVGVVGSGMFSAMGFPSVLSILVCVISYLIPDYFLSDRLQKRQKAIYKDMPIMAGLVATAIKAGVELGPALEMVGKSLTGPLEDEMKQTWKEIATGKPRSSCLKRMAQRTGVPIMERFVETVLTAEERGSERISDSLNNFMHDLQISQGMKAEEEARKLPTKMLLPLILIFLAMLAILMTPVVSMLMKAF